MRRLLIPLFVLICTFSYAQKEISQQSVNELVNKATGFLGLESNPDIKAALNKCIATYQRVGAVAAIETFRKEVKNRRDLLTFMDRALANRESMTQMLAAVGASQKTSQEVLEYFFPKNGARRVPVKDTTPAPPEPQVTKPAEPVVLQPPSKKFFEGRKTFCDSTGRSYYTVIIIKGSVLLNKYSGKPSDRLATATTKSKAQISGDDILTAETHAINFRYDNNTLFEKDDFGRWIKYNECSE